MPSSRKTTPPPLNFGSSYQAMTSPTASPTSETSESRSFSSDYYLLSTTTTLSPSSSPPSPSYSGTTLATGRKASTNKIKPQKVNANSYCGRHSDEFLFGGHGFGDLWRSLRNNKKD